MLFNPTEILKKISIKLKVLQPIESIAWQATLNHH